jgi:hypothetical protein
MVPAQSKEHLVYSIRPPQHWLVESFANGVTVVHSPDWEAFALIAFQAGTDPHLDLKDVIAKGHFHGAFLFHNPKPPQLNPVEGSGPLTATVAFSTFNNTPAHATLTCFRKSGFNIVKAFAAPVALFEKLSVQLHSSIVFPHEPVTLPDRRFSLQHGDFFASPVPAAALPVSQSPAAANLAGVLNLHLDQPSPEIKPIPAVHLKNVAAMMNGVPSLEIPMSPTPAPEVQPVAPSPHPVPLLSKEELANIQKFFHDFETLTPQHTSSNPNPSTNPLTAKTPMTAFNNMDAYIRGTYPSPVQPHNPAVPSQQHPPAAPLPPASVHMPPPLPPVQPVQWVHYTEPEQGTYIVDVPRGWTMHGGFRHPMPGDRRPWLKATSPDEILIACDLVMPQNLCHFRDQPEGQLANTAAGIQLLNLTPTAERMGDYFVQNFAAQTFGAMQKQQRRPRPDVVTMIQDLLRQFGVPVTPNFRITVDEQLFTVSRHDEKFVLSVLSSAVFNGEYVMWNWGFWDGNVWIYVAPPHLTGKAEEVRAHMQRSMQRTPKLMQIYQQDEAQITANSRTAHAAQVNWFNQEQAIHNAQNAIGDSIVASYWRK